MCGQAIECELKSGCGDVHVLVSDDGQCIMVSAAIVMQFLKSSPNLLITSIFFLLAIFNAMFSGESFLSNDLS